MKSGSLVVKHHSPMYWRVVISLIVLAVIGAGWALYYYGLTSAGYLRENSEQKISQMEKHIGMLSNEKIALRDEIALIERSSQVDKQAYQEVKDNLKSLQQEILELREEVSFYRGIVSPLESSTGIRIERFAVEEISNNVFHYELVLTQVLKNDRTVRGKAKLVISGLKGERSVSYNLKELASAKSRYLDFKFRYFQKFEGDIVIPKDFSPRQVMVEVNPKRRKKISSTFPWPSAANKTGEQSEKNED